MYPAMYQTQMMVQILGGQQANGQCPPMHPQQLHISNPNTFYPNDYVQFAPDVVGLNRHRIIQQTGNYPRELLQLVNLDHPPTRHTGYGMQNGNNSAGNWQRRGSTTNNGSPLAMPLQSHINYRQQSNGAGTLKKPNWSNNKGNRRNNYQRQNNNAYCQRELYSSDSGFSSRSPTPNKHQSDNSLTESSDDKDSIGSSNGGRSTSSKSNERADNKRLQEVQQTQSLPSLRTIPNNLLVNGNAQQYYHNQRSLQYYQSCVMSPRPQSAQANYQPKRRFNSGRNSPPQRNQGNNRRRYNSGNSMSPNLSPTSRSRCLFNSAPDRFMARSHLIEATETPANLLIGSPWDDLSKDIWNKFIKHQQTKDTYLQKMNLWKILYMYMKEHFNFILLQEQADMPKKPQCYEDLLYLQNQQNYPNLPIDFLFQGPPRYGIFVVGSTMNGFGSDNSDIDMCLIVKHHELLDPRHEALIHLENVMRVIQKSSQLSEVVGDLELIQAKVPILKFRDKKNNLEVDLNCNNAVGIRNTHLLHCYSQIDWRVRPLVLVVKLWAQSQDINDAKNMTISSYSLVLMVIYFLQCGVSTPVLPCLHEVCAGKFTPYSDIHSIDIHEQLNIKNMNFTQRNTQTLGELFVEFFRYYSSFDFSQYAISVRLARKIPIEECRQVLSMKNDPHQWKHLCIEEPFDRTNTARSVYDPDVFAKIRRIIKVTYKRLSENRGLNSVFIKLDGET